jgi:DNA-binding transcriptional ArsR family regulator
VTNADCPDWRHSGAGRTRLAVSGAASHGAQGLDHLEVGDGEGTEPQLALLACAARQEIVDVLAEMSSVSVAEIAATLGKPADVLYFHLRVLKKSGLVKQAGRIRGGRKEALYRTVERELAVSDQLFPCDPGYVLVAEVAHYVVSRFSKPVLLLALASFGRSLKFLVAYPW